ncbi:YdeI/OmpD-associated family protein [Roseobacteraceae bacterium S113]
MADVDRLEVPEDLGGALERLRADWDRLAPSHRRNVRRSIKLAKTPKTRAARLTKVAQATKRGEKLAQM